MGMGKAFSKELLVVGVLLGEQSIEEAIRIALERRFGGIFYSSPKEIFKWTDYYNQEMGENIDRYYYAFETLVDPSMLASIKTATNAIEMEFAIDSRRRVNLDPGLVAPGRFVLATTKDRAHRIALSEGIYAELTLIFQHKSYRALEWTYPDWASEPVRSMLGELRAWLLAKLKREDR
jgi:hypothetical protein